MDPIQYLAPENTLPETTTLAPQTNVGNSPLPPAQAQKRTEKANYGLSNVTQQSYKEMYDQIANGEEESFRQVAASKIDFERSMARDRALTEWAAKKGSPLTIDEAIRVVSPYSREGRADPRDVIEKAYASNFVSSANTAATYMKNTLLDDAILDMPEHTAKTQEKAGELMTRLELLRTMRENVENDLSQQGWLPWAADQAKLLIQPYSEIKMRGLNPEVGMLSGGLGLGENIREQADRLWDLPYPKFKEGVSKIVNDLRKDNPTLARQFLEYMTSPSQTQRVLDNAFTMIMPFDYAALAKTPSLLRNIERANRVNKTFKDIVAASEKAGKEVPAKAVAEEGSGNVAQAGITRATENITRTLDGSLDPVVDIKEKFTSNFRLDGDVFDTNPGTYLSREVLTRMKDAFYSRGNNLYETVVNALRVNRTPIPLATEDALKAYQIAARNDFPGLNNSILDISSPRLDEVTNTHHITYTFGNRDGRLFSSIEKAEAYAREHGFADPRIVKATGEVEVKEATYQGKYTDIRTKERLEKSIPKTEELIRRERAKAFNKTLTKEERAAAREQWKLAKEFLEDEKAKLAEINKVVTLGEPVIEQQGLGFKFSVVRPYKETDEVVRKWLINKDGNNKYTGPGASSASQEGFQSWRNSILGWIRGADDTLAFNESLQRKVATYTQSLLREWAKADAEAIEQLANRFKWYKPQTWFGKIFSHKEVFEQWNDTLKFAKTATDPKTGEPGYFFKSPGELQDHYQRWYHRDPTVMETEAYFAHVRLIEADRVLSEIAEFRNRARLGAEQHQIFVQQGTTRLASGFFDGIHQQEFPRGDDNVIVMGGRIGEEKVYNLQHIPTKDRQKLEQSVAEGRTRVIRIYDPDSHPLKSISDIAGSKRIRYIITGSSETKPLDFNHVNRRGGGHFDVDADFFIKQANMVDESTGLYPELASKFRRIYRGDTTLMPISNRAMGDDLVKILNEVNRLMAAGEEDAARLASARLGIEWDELSSWYKPGRDKDGKVAQPRINPNEPFYVVSRNKKIYDIDKSLEERHGKDLFKDGTKSGSDALQFKVAYNEVRDSGNLKTIRDEGTQGNPLYKYVPAEYVDPIPTMNRALNRAINSTFMDDYKIYAVEHWLTEAIPHMKDSEELVRSSPFYYFNTATDKGVFKPDTPERIRWNLLSNRFKIQQFVGTPSSMDTAIHGLTQIAADAFYRKFGPEETRSGLAKAATIVPLWALDRVKDPVSAIRSFAFNAKLGVFAIPQFIVQAQTYTTIFALNPRQAMAGTYAYMLHNWSRINANPEVLASLDKYASKMKLFGSNWKPGEWLEARAELNKTGFANVGGEHQIADDIMQYKTIKNEWNNFLSAGQFFFREGEKASRIGAYYTAFKEFRDANPVKIITDADRQRILQKADLLTVNMSRASASALHGGVLSLTTQFLSYQLRMAELFFGKRIGETTAERTLARARLMTFYAAMYGAPSALGITGYPFGDSIREEAIKNGYQVGDKFLSSLLMEGIPAMSLAMITGKGDFQKGNFYNIGDRYGSQGFTQIRESLRTDKTMWSIFGGAGVNSIVNTIANLDPFWRAAKNLISDDEEGNTFKLKFADFAAVFNEVSTVDATTRWYRALNTGRWISKNGQYIDDVSAGNATFMAMITGTKPQEQDDIFAVKNIKDAEKNIWAKAQKAITNDYQRGIEAAENNDPETANVYFNRVRARLIIDNVPLDMRAEIMSKASRGYEKAIDNSQKYWATKAVPAGQEDKRLESYTRYLNLQDKRTQ